MSAAQVNVGSRPIKSLNGATATGAGTALDNDFIRNNHVCQVEVTGSPTSFTVTLEGSLDNTTWVSLGSATAAGAFWAVDKPVRYVRANLSALVGAGTFSAYIGSV